MFFARLWLVPSFADLCQLSKSGNLCLPESATHSLFVAWRNRTKRKRRRFQLPGLECIFKLNKSVGHPCRPSFGAILHGGFIAFLRSCWKKTNKNWHQSTSPKVFPKIFGIWRGPKLHWSFHETPSCFQKVKILTLDWTSICHFESHVVFCKGCFISFYSHVFPNAQPTSKWVRTNRSVQTTLAFRQSLGRVASNHSWWWLFSYEIYSPQKTYGTWIRPPRRNFWNFLWWVQGIARPFGGVRKGRSPNDTLNPAIFSGGVPCGGYPKPLKSQTSILEVEILYRLYQLHQRLVVCPTRNRDVILPEKGMPDWLQPSTVSLTLIQPTEPAKRPACHWASTTCWRNTSIAIWNLIRRVFQRRNFDSMQTQPFTILYIVWSLWLPSCPLCFFLMGKARSPTTWTSNCQFFIEPHDRQRSHSVLHTSETEGSFFWHQGQVAKCQKTTSLDHQNEHEV